MKVRATNPGVFHSFRNIGDVFDIPDNLFSKQWMEIVKEEHVPPIEPVKIQNPLEAEKGDDHEG